MLRFALLSARASRLAFGGAIVSGARGFVPETLQRRAAARPFRVRVPHGRRGPIKCTDDVTGRRATVGPRAEGNVTVKFCREFEFVGNVLRLLTNFIKFFLRFLEVLINFSDLFLNLHVRIIRVEFFELLVNFRGFASDVSSFGQLFPPASQRLARWTKTCRTFALMATRAE